MREEQLKSLAVRCHTWRGFPLGLAVRRPHAAADAAAAGHTSGEKKLRALLSRTREWRSASVREDAACRADAEGLSDLASALRGRNVTGFRKRDFFALCRLWGYRSNIWTPLGEIKLCTPPARRPARAAPPPRATDPAADMLRCEVAAALAAFQHYNRLPSLAAATAADPRAPLATMDVQARVGARPRRSKPACIQHTPDAARAWRCPLAVHARRADLVG